MAISIAPSADGDVVEMAELIAERCVTVITDSIADIADTDV